MSDVRHKDVRWTLIVQRIMLAWRINALLHVHIPTVPLVLYATLRTIKASASVQQGMRVILMPSVSEHRNQLALLTKNVRWAWCAPTIIVRIPVLPMCVETMLNAKWLSHYHSRA